MSEEDLTAVIREAQALISAGEDASHLLAKLSLDIGVEDVAEKKAQVPETEGEERAVRKERRAALKAKRAELKVLLAQLDAQLDGASSSRGSVKSSRSCRSDVSHREGAAPGPSLVLKPPVLDPKEIIPPHIIEGFRAEYRAKMASEAAPLVGSAVKSAATAAPEDGTSRSTSRSSARQPGSTSLEDLEERLGLRPSAPKAEPDYKKMTHGAKPGGRAFVLYPGAESREQDPGQVPSPGKKKSVHGSRAAQSSMGAIMFGTDDPAPAH